MPNNLLHERDLGQGLRQLAYDQLVAAFYPYVARNGEIDLVNGGPETDATYEHLLETGFEAAMLQFLAKKAVLDIPEIKDEFVRLRPEHFGEGDYAEA